MIGDCSRESKTDSELECFGVLKYKIGTAADLEEQSKKNVETKEKKESDESIESKERKKGDELKTGNESQKEGVVKEKEESDEFETCDDESPKVMEEESKEKEIEQSEKNESQKEGVVEDSKKKEEGTENSECSETDESVECKKMKGGQKSDESEETEVSIKKPSEKNVQKSKHKGGGGGHLPCYYCGETFSSIYSLRAHLDYVHPWQPSDSTSQETSNNEETDNKVCDVKMTKECCNVSQESSTEETQKEEKSETSNEEISVVNETNPSDISIVKESEGSDEERKQNKAKDTSLDTSEVKVTKMQESDNKVEIVNVIETNVKKGQEEVKELSPDRSIVKLRNPKLITLKDMPTRQRDETRGQFMCRLVLQMKNRDNCYIKKDDVVCSDTSFSDLTSGDNGDVSDEVHNESSVM